MTSSNVIHSCEVCGQGELQPVLDLGLHPLCDDLVSITDTRRCEEYPIEILYCSGCQTAHQRFQIPKRELFPVSYHYRSRFTADVLMGMSALVDACENRVGGLGGKLVLDVGCNDGSLLDFFKAKGATTVGIEPTDAYRDGLDKGHGLVNDFFVPRTANEIREKYGCPDVITFTNVFAHIENLSEVIEALTSLMSPSTILVIENHYLGSVLERHQFDTFYHEHPRTYSFNSFRHIAKSLNANLSGVEFPARYGGNIRVFIGGSSALDKVSSSSLAEAEQHFGARLRQMQSEVDQWRNSMTETIRELVAKHGRLAAKAFPGRAAILVKLLNLDSDTIDAVYEKPGSMKIGNYLPGTRIPIKSDDEFFGMRERPTVVLNLAWHISAEIRTYLKERGYAGEIVDILDPQQLSKS